jgi:hypothetical protein
MSRPLKSLIDEFRANFKLPLQPPLPKRDPKRDEDLENLKTVCFCLNIRVREAAFLTGQRNLGQNPEELTGFSQSLRSLVEEWKSSGPDTELMKKKNPSLWEKIKHVTVSIQPTNNGAVKIEPAGIPRENQGLSDDDSFVYGFFLLLIMCRHWQRLGGPCARCGNYYIKHTSRQKVYCSKQCGVRRTSVDCNRQRRQDERREKLKRVRKLIMDWQTLGSKGDWKRWVANKSGLSAYWLTRAVNKDEIDEPTQ